MVRMDAVAFVCLAVIWARSAMRQADSVRDAPPIVGVGHVVRTDVGEAVCPAVMWVRFVMR